MKTLVINDLHLGVQRSGGTTQNSGVALRAYAHQMHRELLDLANDGDTVLVNGDLTDVYDIPLGQAIEVYIAASQFLKAKPKAKLIWALGNHDLSKDSSKLGSVAFIGALLVLAFPDRFTLIDAPAQISDAMYVIPHVPNQDIFDMELTRVPEGTKWLFLHCNFDNTFAGQMDHSLNLSRAQAKVMRDRGVKMVLGHEHQPRDVLGGAVMIVGNQFPTSVADCLENETKRCIVIDGAGFTEHLTWSRTDKVGYYREVDWRDVAGLIHEPSGFIRVAGKASAEEAADVVKAISTLRSKSEAFVITNAVQIATAAGLEDIAESIEDMRSVNVIDLLLEALSPEHGAAVRQLLGRGDESPTQQEPELEAA